MADDSSKNPYIRTYAQDVAALQGKEPPASIPAPKTSEPAPSAPPPEVDTERQAVLDRLRERAVKDPVHQSEMLPRTMPTPLPKAESTDEEPVLPPPVVVVPPPLPPPPPTPEPVAPPPPPVSEHLSILPPAPPQPQPVVEVAPLPPAPPQATPSESPIHTYKSDFSDRIDTKEASTFSVLAAQSDAGQLKTAPVAGKRKHSTGPLFAAAGLVLIILAGGGVYAAYRYVAMHSVVPIGQSIPSLVFADDRQALTGEGRELVGAIAASAETPLPDGHVRVLYLTVASTTSDGKTVMLPLAGGRLIGSLQLNAPDILLRNVAPDSTIGIVHAGTETRAFFILKVLSYERTFAGMLQWENTIQSTLNVLYPEYPALELPPATGTSTPTAPVITQPLRFIDEVTSNHDVRALKDGQGNTVLLYGYKDKETLVIARDEAAFAELLNRLSATKEQ